MGAGYTRQAQDNIVDGAVIDSDDLNAEFNQVEAAFNSTTGHTHDGTEGEGPQIDTAGLADDAVTGAKIDSTTTVTAASFVGPLTGNVTGNADTATALTGVTASDAELNILDGATISTTELNYLDGVTSNIQTQLDNAGGGSGDVSTTGNARDGAVVVYNGTSGDSIQDSDSEITLRLGNAYYSDTSGRASQGYTSGDSIYLNVQNVDPSRGVPANSVVIGDVSSNMDFVRLSNSVLIGHNIGATNDFAPANTVAIGYGAGVDSLDEDAVLIGANAGANGGSGASVIIGSGACANGGGSSNVTIGYQAATNGSPTGSVFIGRQAGGGTGPTGETSVVIGDTAGYSLTTGFRHVLIGHQAGEDITTADGHTAVGFHAGKNITGNGFGHVCLGYLAGADSGLYNITNETTEGIIVIGNSANTNAYVAVNWTVPSDARDKTDFEDLNIGLDFINSVEPKTFHYDHRSQYYVYDNDGDIIEMPEPDGTHKTTKKFLGFSAQQVQEAVEATGFPDQIIIDSSDPEHYKMKETAFIPALVKAVQELTARVEQLEAQLNSQ